MEYVFVCTDNADRSALAACVLRKFVSDYGMLWNRILPLFSL